VSSHFKVTIITPSFNQGKFLEETICSVLGQGYPHLEYIVIDGGSTDDSLNIIRKYAHSLTYWESKKDSGQSEAINKGLIRATGDIIMWLNSDDVLLPGCLEKANDYFQNNPGTDFIHGKAILFNEKGLEKTIGTIDDNLEARYLAYIPFPQPASLFRKSVLDSIGLLNEQLHYAMDYDLLVRIYLGGYHITKVDWFFSKYRLHPASKTNQQLKFTIEWAQIFSKVLRSLENTESLISTLRKAGLMDETEKAIPVKKKVPAPLIKEALLFHLLIQAHYAYQDLDLAKTRLLLNSIRATDLSFYKNHKLAFLNLKSRLLPRKVISFMRKLKKRLTCSFP
jgi:glycosyltransferase involved in cell wall biosynthesis